MRTLVRMGVTAEGSILHFDERFKSLEMLYHRLYCQSSPLPYVALLAWGQKASIPEALTEDGYSGLFAIRRKVKSKK